MRPKWPQASWSGSGHLSKRRLIYPIPALLSEELLLVHTSYLTPYLLYEKTLIRKIFSFFLCFFNSIFILSVRKPSVQPVYRK